MCNKALPIITRDSWHNPLSNEKSSSSPLLYVNHPNTSLLNPEQAYPQNSQNPRMMFPNPPVVHAFAQKYHFHWTRRTSSQHVGSLSPDSYSKCSWPQFFHSKSFSLAYPLALVVPANQLISPTLPPKKNPELPPAIEKSSSNPVGCLICHS